METLSRCVPPLSARCHVGSGNYLTSDVTVPQWDFRPLYQTRTVRRATTFARDFIRIMYQRDWLFACAVLFPRLLSVGVFWDCVGFGRAQPASCVLPVVAEGSSSPQIRCVSGCSLLSEKWRVPRRMLHPQSSPQHRPPAAAESCPFVAGGVQWARCLLYDVACSHISLLNGRGCHSTRTYWKRGLHPLHKREFWTSQHALWTLSIRPGFDSHMHLQSGSLAQGSSPCPLLLSSQIFLTESLARNGSFLFWLPVFHGIEALSTAMGREGRYLSEIHDLRASFWKHGLPFQTHLTSPTCCTSHITDSRHTNCTTV